MHKSVVKYMEILKFERFMSRRILNVKKIKHIMLSASFRLFWPKSKCYDYLYQEAEVLLKKFPIQATISFYEDSDSEEEIEELIDL